MVSLVLSEFPSAFCALVHDLGTLGVGGIAHDQFHHVCHVWNHLCGVPI